jgi:hypothetical protein
VYPRTEGWTLLSDGSHVVSDTVRRRVPGAGTSVTQMTSMSIKAKSLVTSPLARSTSWEGTFASFWSMTCTGDRVGWAAATAGSHVRVVMVRKAEESAEN